MVYLITGGARSGKSSQAQRLALELSPRPVYVATARIWDDDFAERVRKHQADRGPAWTLFEEEQYISKLPLEGKTVVIDCITLWLTNFFVASNYDVNSTLNAVQEEINRLLKQPATFIFVTNEIGMGVHAETAAGRQFTDLQGWVNQFVARIANTVILMVSGIPVVIKEEK
jgi:adenosylcobinamide kinase/adenosylcobinamide-phosphate guanylyltransferase